MPPDAWRIFSNDRDTSSGGGIDNGATENVANPATAVVISSTFSGDKAPSRGGAIGSGQGASSTTVSTTLAGDLLVETPSEGACIGTIIDAGYNVSSDRSCAFEAVNHSVADSPAIDSYIGPLEDNGGPTETVALMLTPAGTTAGPDPALDAIPASFDVPGTTTSLCSQPDQRGEARTSPCDVGAFDQSTSDVYASMTGSGSSCTQASPCSLLTALSTASSQTVLLAGGTYKGQFAVTSSVALEPAPGAGAVVLDGEQGGSVLTISAGESVDLDDLTVEEGANADGGGVLAEDGVTLGVTGCTFGTDAATSGDGGGIDIADAGTGTLVVSKSTFTSDTAANNGGAIDDGDNTSAGGTLEVNGSTFSDDSAGSGGAIDDGNGNGQATATVTGSTFSDDSAINDGGAIDNGDGSGSGTLTVTESLFKSDSAGNGGAVANGIATSTGVLDVTASTFWQDSATDGGAIDSGDNLDEGGTDTGSAVVAGSTFDDNSASDSGASIAQDDNGGSGTTGLAGDIITDVASGSECSPGGIVDDGYNVSDDGTCNLTPDNGSIGQSSTIDDYLGSLSQNGGPTETIPLLVDATDGVTSPDPAAGVVPVGFSVPGTTTPYCSVADQRGFARESDDCDIGAYDAWSTTSLAASGASVPFGQPVTYTATVSNGEPAGTSGGSVSFAVGSAGGAAAPCGAGSSAFGTTTMTATCIVTWSSVGTFDLVATWSGDGSEPSSSSSAVSVVVSPVVPSAPIGLSATRGNAQVSLSWTAPASAGGSTITGYDVYEGTAPGGEPATPVNGSLVTGTSYDVTGLTNGTTYYFTVEAVNAVGNSTASDEASATPASNPGAPTGLAGTRGNAQVLLSWRAPSSTGGSTVTGYDVYEGTAPGGESGTPLNGSLVTGTTYDVTGLTNGTTYYFTVEAVNAVGNSTASNEASATPATAASAPLDLKAVGGNERATLSWAAPASTGGSAVTGYDVYEGTRSGGESTKPVNASPLSASTRSYAIGALRNGTAYYFEVRATNAAGLGAASNQAVATPVAAGRLVALADRLLADRA